MCARVHVRWCADVSESPRPWNAAAPHRALHARCITAMPGVRPNEYDAREEGAQFCHGGARWHMPASHAPATCHPRRLPASCGISRRKCPAFDPGADVARAGRLCSPRRLAARTWPAQLAINSGEPSQAAEVAVCRLHAVCGTRRRQWQYLGTSVGGAGVLVLLVKIGRRPGRDLATCFGARRPRRVGDLRGVGWSAVHARSPLVWDAAARLICGT